MNESILAFFVGAIIALVFWLIGLPVPAPNYWPAIWGLMGLMLTPKFLELIKYFLSR